MCTEQPAILLPYQKAWILDRSRVKFCEKSRRTGITWATALEAVIVASEDESLGGMDVYFMTYAEDDAKEFIRDCMTWAKVMGVLHGEVWVEEEEGSGFGRESEKVSVQILKIEFPGGLRIHALAGRPRKFRGKQGFAIIDEGAHVDDLDGIMTATKAFLMWGGRVAVISTHFGEENAFNKIVCLIRDGEKKGWALHSIPLAEAIHQGLARRIALVTREEWSPEWEEQWEADLRSDYGEGGDEELDCIPSRQGQSYFDPIAVGNCRTQGLPVLRWKQPREWGDLPKKQRETACDEWIQMYLAPILKALNPMKGHCLGVDFARYSDGSVWVLGQVVGDVRRCVLTLELSCIPLRQQEQILGFLIRNAPRLYKANMDKTGNGFALCEWAVENFGTMVEGFALTPKWHDETWPELHKAVRERTNDIPDDDECAADFNLIELIDGKPRVAKRRVKGKAGGMRHGDFAVANALMYSASKGIGSGLTAVGGTKRESNRRIL